MRIRSLGVIDDAVVELSPGFTAVTGETGAGKTMVVTSLGLLLGGRADPALVRIGAKAAVVEGRISVSADGPAAVRAEEAGAELEDGMLLISRTVSAEGRSRAHVGGRSVPVGVLGELADELVAVHGQTDQQGLLRPARQREALDRYAGGAVTGPHAKYAAAYRRLRAVSVELDELTTRARERAQEADLLRFGLNEIAGVEPRAARTSNSPRRRSGWATPRRWRPPRRSRTARWRAIPRTRRASTRRRWSRARDGPWTPYARTTPRWPGSPTGWARSPSCSVTWRESWPGTRTIWTPIHCGWPRWRNGGRR